MVALREVRHRAGTASWKVRAVGTVPMTETVFMQDRFPLYAYDEENVRHAMGRRVDHPDSKVYFMTSRRPVCLSSR